MNEKTSAGHRADAQAHPHCGGAAAHPGGSGGRRHAHQLRHPLLSAAGAGLPGGAAALRDGLPSGVHQHDHRGGDAHKRAAGHEGRDRRGAGRAEHLLAQRCAGPGGAGGDAAGRPSAVPVRQERLHHPYRPAGGSSVSEETMGAVAQIKKYCGRTASSAASASS